MARVNELAVLAKSDSAVIPELWQMVERLIRTVCMKYCRPESGTRLYDLDDLCQSAYTGFVKAVEAYNPERGAFSGLLIYHVRTTCAKEIGKYGKRDAIFDSGSLDAPLDDNFTYADVLPAPDVDDDFAAVDVKAMVEIILELADGLLDKRKGIIIREHTYQGMPIRELAEAFGISRQRVNELEYRAIQDLRRISVIRDMRAEYRTEIHQSARESAVSAHRTKSITAFRSDFTSVVESIIMRLEEP